MDKPSEEWVRRMFEITDAAHRKTMAAIRTPEGRAKLMAINPLLNDALRGREGWGGGW